VNVHLSPEALVTELGAEVVDITTDDTAPA
jgi:hypothetical protein